MPGRVLLVDPVAPGPYDDRTLRTRAMGGTEATVVRVAGALARSRPVVVAQAARRHARRGDDGVWYVPYQHRRERRRRGIEAVIVVRAHKILPGVRRLYPEARAFLWMHCFPGRRLRPLARVAATARATVVAVSDYHLAWMRAFYAEHDVIAARAVDSTRVYNPIAPGLEPDGSAYDRDKLVFLSSPHKGLDQVYEAFQVLRRRIPTLRLHVANPGYLERRFPDLEGVLPLGALPHDQVVRHLRDALCLFYPQSTFEETFGLVFAEAHAVGTPVLAHPLGAAPEVVACDRQLCDVTDIDEVCERIARWRDGDRPGPAPRPELELDAVIEVWEGLLRSAYPVRAGAAVAPHPLAVAAAR
jgi:glycosyltransferase involved in cell wall biosynthesis